MESYTSLSWVMRRLGVYPETVATADNGKYTKVPKYNTCTSIICWALTPSHGYEAECVVKKHVFLTVTMTAA